MYAASPRPLEKFQARFDHFQELKLCFPFLVNPFNINVSVMAVQMANRLPTGWLTVCYKLVCCRNKTDRNARKSRSKITLANATPHLILVNRFQKTNIQNLKYQCITHFCVKHSMVLWFFFSVMKFVKSNHRATLKNEHLGELIRTGLTTCCPGFRRLENQTKTWYWQLLYII